MTTRHPGTTIRVGSELILLNPRDTSVLPALSGVERVIVLLTSADPFLRDVVMALRDDIRREGAAHDFDLFMPIDRTTQTALAWRDLSPRHADVGHLTSSAHVEVYAFTTSSGSGSRGYALHARHEVGPGANRPLLVYTGGTKPCYAVQEASQMAQVLIHDASYSADSDGAAAAAGLSTSAQAAAVARTGGVRRLVLISHRPLPAGAVASIEEEAAGFFRDVHVANGTLAFRITEDEVEQLS